jgi:hypothetical protein
MGGEFDEDGAREGGGETASGGGDVVYGVGGFLAAGLGIMLLPKGHVGSARSCRLQNSGLFSYSFDRLMRAVRELLGPSDRNRRNPRRYQPGRPPSCACRHALHARSARLADKRSATCRRLHRRATHSTRWASPGPLRLSWVVNNRLGSENPISQVPHPDATLVRCCALAEPRAGPLAKALERDVEHRDHE